MTYPPPGGTDPFQQQPDPYAAQPPMAPDPYAPPPVANPYAQPPAYGSPAVPGSPVAPPGSPVAPSAPPYGEPYKSGPATVQQPYAQPYAQQPYYPAARPQNSMALVALILSLVGLLTWITAPIGAILGHSAMKQIRQSGEDGEGLAKAAIIVGCLCVFGLPLLGLLGAAGSSSIN